MRKLILILMVILLGGCTPKEVVEIRPLFTMDTYPVIDGSTVTIPLSEALMATLTSQTVLQVRPYVLHNKTHQAYVNLVDHKANLIFVTGPSAEESAYALLKQCELKITPIVSEAFVFLTNIDNPVDSLTFEQIQKIYAGEITNWKEVGGEDVSIRALQRPVNSGSQTGFLDLVMKDITPMNPPLDWIEDAMEGLISSVSQYDNKPDAIGYSFYYYVTDMEVNPNVKMLKIDGIMPTPLTIANGTYRIKTNYYAVYCVDPETDKDAIRIVNYILSEEGQQLMENAGYVKLK
jgi:phosphate transport system substrate-binding protein